MTTSTIRVSMTDCPVVRIDCENPQGRLIDQAVALLLRGDLVVAPTETRYGLLARADDSKSLEKLYRMKGRDRAAAVAIFVDSIEALDTYGVMTPSARRLAKRFMPGPLTLVLTAADKTALPVESDGRVGLRVSSSPVVKAILEQVRKPLTATSANPTGHGEAETIDQVVEAFGSDVALYLDAGRLAGPVSTVVLCQGDQTELLREGALSATGVASVLEETA
ncbi:MAG: threonylcarbamoyl-AMP synthase [candidate division Zixibacteria bacterium]|nr:threonylcarbamoyl-AMP synthase [candidate division Zixibacteria bacterium]